MDCFSLGARPLTCSIANTRELNSWPKGMPANVIPVSSPGRLTEKLGVRFKDFSVIVMCADISAISFNNSLSSFDLSSEPRLATNSTSPSISSSNCCNCCFKSALSIF